MTPTLERTSETEYVLTFPAEGRRRRTHYAIAFDPFLRRWSVHPPLPHRMMDTSETLRALVEQVVRYERMIRTNLHLTDFDAQYEDAQTYLRNGAATARSPRPEEAP